MKHLIARTFLLGSLFFTCNVALSNAVAIDREDEAILWGCKSTAPGNDSVIEISEGYDGEIEIVYYSASRGLSWMQSGLTLTHGNGFTPSDLIKLPANSAGESVDMFVNYYGSDPEVAEGHAKIKGYSKTLMDSDISCQRHTSVLGQ